MDPSGVGQHSPSIPFAAQPLEGSGRVKEVREVEEERLKLTVDLIEQEDSAVHANKVM